MFCSIEFEAGYPAQKKHHQQRVYRCGCKDARPSGRQQNHKEQKHFTEDSEKKILTRRNQQNAKRCRKAQKDEEQDKMFVLVDSKIASAFKAAISVEG